MVGELVQRGQIGWNADLGQGEEGTDQTQKVGVVLDALLGHLALGFAGRVHAPHVHRPAGEACGGFGA